MRSIALRCLPLVALSLASTACDPPAPPVTATSSAPQPSPPAASPPLGPSDPAKVAPAFAPAGKAPSTDELKVYAKSNNAFAFDLFAKTRAQKGNLAFSPFSISTALAMTWAGARGDTAEQMRKVLHLTGPSDRVLDVAGALIGSYGARDQKITLRVANRLFGEKSYAFEAPYLNRVKAAFGAPLEPLDFKTAAEDGRARINAWVAKETQDRIKDLLPPNALLPDTRLVLTNAIYFLGDWATPFEKERTSPAPFFTTKTDQKNVPTMHASDYLSFGSAPGVKLLELPYQNGALAMTFVLPDAVDGLDALEAQLTPDVLDGWLARLSTVKVVTSLPKFEIDPAQSMSLGDQLRALGMPLAFDRDHADFTAIANPPSPADRLYIAKVFHKAFLRVDEKGTEAAAATAVVAIGAGAAAPTMAPPEFKADHPFLFLLRDTRTGMILFMGRVGDPGSR